MPGWAEPKTIKFATLAPEGSTWMKVMEDLNAELQKATGGQLKFKMYPGGVSGDEKDVVRKVRIGQLQSGGFTGVGLGEIAPETRVLDAPWLVRDQAELDHLYKAFGPELGRALEKGGYVLLGWTDIGFVYVFSKKPIEGPDDLRRAKVWAWEGDPIAQAAFQALGVAPISLSVIDVMSSLETGLIDTVYGPPMGVIALQWFTRTKYIYSMPIGHATGAVLVAKPFFDQLPADQRKALLDLSAKHFKRLNELSRVENAQALETLQKQGLVLSKKPSPEVVRVYEETGKKARRRLAGPLYPETLLERVEKSLETLRQAHGKAAKG